MAVASAPGGARNAYERGTMEPARGAQDEIVTAPLGASGTGIDAESTTLLLRRCTALAARARVDLLTPGRGGAAAELGEVLDRMRSWDPSALEAPDPTMTVLAAAALQDLAERLRLAARQQEPGPCSLLADIEAALGVLEGIMTGGRVEALA